MNEVKSCETLFFQTAECMNEVFVTCVAPMNVSQMSCYKLYECDLITNLHINYSSSVPLPFPDGLMWHRHGSASMAATVKNYRQGSVSDGLPSGLPYFP